jgi:hypothetical protein
MEGLLKSFAKLELFRVLAHQLVHPVPQIHILIEVLQAVQCALLIILLLLVLTRVQPALKAKPLYQGKHVELVLLVRRFYLVADVQPALLDIFAMEMEVKSLAVLELFRVLAHHHVQPALQTHILVMLLQAVQTAQQIILLLVVLADVTPVLQVKPL